MQNGHRELAFWTAQRVARELLGKTAWPAVMLLTAALIMRDNCISKSQLSTVASEPPGESQF